MADFISLEELEGLAKAKLPKMVYDYYAGGANSQWTVAENRAAFSRYRLLPRVLVDVSQLNTGTSILGGRRLPRSQQLCGVCVAVCVITAGPQAAAPGCQAGAAWSNSAALVQVTRRGCP
jgi:hypothetical protein